jgi:hypothetical protein
MSNTNKEDIKESNWEKFEYYINNNITTFKVLLITLTILIIIYITIIDKKKLQRKQFGGGPVGMYSKGLDKVTGGLSAVGASSPISAAFNVVFSMISTVMMILGIVVILVLIPTIPIMIFLVICYYICRRKIWALRTM